MEKTAETSIENRRKKYFKLSSQKESIQSFVEYWGNNENVSNYMLDRANAKYELVLFLEYIPYIKEVENTNQEGQLVDFLLDYTPKIIMYGIRYYLI